MTKETPEEILDQEEEDLYGSSESLIRDIQEALDDHDFETVTKLVEPLHAADFADVLSAIIPAHRYELMNLMDVSLRAEVFLELSPLIREDIAEHLGTVGLIQLLSEFDTDQAIEFVEDLSNKQQTALLQLFTKDQRRVIEESLSFPEESAGRLMSREFVFVPAFWTVARTTEYLRESGDLPDAFDEIIVIDPRHRPVGTINVSDLIRNNGEKRIRQLMDTDIKIIPYDTDQEEVASLFTHYSLSSAPVVDDEGRVLGLITSPDVIQVLDEEASEDMLLLGGVKESDFYAPVFTTWYQRVGWLMINLINTLMTVTVLQHFEASLAQKSTLAVLLPLAGALGGSAGTQVQTVTVRAISTRELRSSNTLRALSKELAVGLLQGLFFALVLFGLVSLWFHEPKLGMVIGAAVCFNMLWAGLAGFFFPVLIDRWGLDPAVSVGPVLSTTTDILGYASFLGLATYFLL